MHKQEDSERPLCKSPLAITASSGPEAAIRGSVLLRSVPNGQRINSFDNPELPSLVNRKTIAGTLLLAFFIFIYAFGGFGGLLTIILDLALVAGFVLVLDGIGYFDRTNVRRASAKNMQPLSALDRTILEMISQSKTQDEIARSTGVSPSTITEKSTTLREAGYISSDGLTEKGFDALRGS